MLWRLSSVCAALLLLSQKNKSKSNQVNCVEEFAFGSRFVQHCWSNKNENSKSNQVNYALTFAFSSQFVQHCFSNPKNSKSNQVNCVTAFAFSSQCLCSAAAPFLKKTKIANQTKSTVLWLLPLVLSLCSTTVCLSPLNIFASQYFSQSFQKIQPKLKQSIQCCRIWLPVLCTALLLPGPPK